MSSYGVPGRSEKPERDDILDYQLLDGAGKKEILPDEQYGQKPELAPWLVLVSFSMAVLLERFLMADNEIKFPTMAVTAVLGIGVFVLMLINNANS